VKPDVIVVSISGWGQFGSEASRGGYDPIVQAESGWMALNGVSDGEPIKAPSFLADDLVGLHAAISALAALRHRDQTGEGQHVDVAMLDALLFQSDGFLTLGATGVPLDRWGNETPFLVPSNRYACADGDVYLVIALDKQWRRFAELIGRPEMAEANGFRTNQQRISNRSSVNKMVAEWCAGRTVGDVVGRLDKAGLAVGRVRTFEQVAGDPHILERDMLQTVELSNGASAPIVGPAAKFSRTPTSVRKPAPPAGADTEEVLGSVGIDETARRALREERVI
jgi:formyl-CoA transferase